MDETGVCLTAYMSHADTDMDLRNLAYAEMRLVMARMLWTFDLALDETAHPDDVTTSASPSAPDHESEGTDSEQGPGAWQSQQRVFLIWEKRPLMVKLKAREGAEGAGGDGGVSNGVSNNHGGGSSSGVMPTESSVAESAAWSA